MLRTFKWLAALLCVPAWAQQAAPPGSDLQLILDRLTRLEQQNRELTNEIRSLRERLGGAPASTPENQTQAQAPVPERLDIAEQRIAEVEQTHVATDNRLPVTLTGMLLFNAYLNGQASAGAQYPLVVPATGRGTGAGATMRQTVLGLRADGPTVLGGAKVKGSIFMDFFGGGTGLNQTMRLRVATLDVAWKRTTVGFAFDKPIIAPREPDSLAQVGVSALTGSGNLWLWQPQVRMEHRVNFGEQSGLRAQYGVVQTSESGSGVSSAYADSLASSRPGYETRMLFFSGTGVRRIEIAPGFHASSTRVLGQSVPSRIGSVDWLIRPMSRVEFTGTFFSGSNTGVIGGLRQGVSIYGENGKLEAKAVRAIGGWAQLKILASRRATLNFFGGQQDDRNRDLQRDGVFKNQSYGGNLMFRWGPNLLTSFEVSQTRSTYSSGTRINPHYDLAFAYLF